jgi:hypothetical protein
MKKRLAIIFATAATAAAVFVPGGAGAVQASNAVSTASPLVTRHASVGKTTVLVEAAFESATEVQFLSAEVHGGSQLRVDTKDCCIRGDHWLVTLVNPSGGSTVGAIDEATAACGNGSTRDYSGTTALNVRRGTIKVLVAYCSGVDSFPAGMAVRLRYDGSMSVST